MALTYQGKLFAEYAHFSVMVSVQFFRFSGCGDHPHPPL